MTRHLLLSATTVALLLTACGAESTPDATTGEATGEAVGVTTASVPPTVPDGGDAAAACLEGATECDDIPTGSGGVTSQPDGSVLVEDAVRSGIDGPFLVSGYAVTEGGSTRLCAVLLESMPPHCGLPSVKVELGGADLGGDWSVEGDVTWSQERVVLEGELVDDVFVVGAP